MRSPSGVWSRKTAISLQIGNKGYDPPVYGCPLSDQRRPGRTSDQDNERLQDGDLREVEGLLARSIGKNAGKSPGSGLFRPQRVINGSPLLQADPRSDRKRSNLHSLRHIPYPMLSWKKQKHKLE